MSTRSPNGPHASDRWLVPAGQVALGLALLGLWQLVGRVTGSTWISEPGLILSRLASWAAGDLLHHLLVTMGEIVCGLAVGATLGIGLGILLGSARVAGVIVRPIVVLLYNIPIVTIVPLFIFWFGFGMAPKIVIVTISVFFIMFFHAYSGAASVDQELLRATEIMGATRRERFRKVVLPASLMWISAGAKIALPYSLVAATTGEMLAAREGLGWQLSRSAAQFDMAGVYAVLFVLMLIGMLFADLATRLESFLLKWRDAGA